MNRTIKTFLALAVATLAMTRVHASPAPDVVGPVGSWKTIDDKTGRERSIVRIDVTNGVLIGRIARSLDPDDAPDARCARCKGALKDQPILGMALISGLRSEGDARHWAGGEIIDPETGESYSAKVVVAADGKTLEVRGFIGISLFGRSQTWVRVP